MESSFPFIRPGPGARVLVLHVEVEVKWHLHPVGWQVEEEEEDLGSSVKSVTAGEPDEKTSPSLLFNRCFLLTLNTSIHLSSVWIITLLLLAELMLLRCCVVVGFLSCLKCGDEVSRQFVTSVHFGGGQRRRGNWAKCFRAAGRSPEDVLVWRFEEAPINFLFFPLQKENKGKHKQWLRRSEAQDFVFCWEFCLFEDLVVMIDGLCGKSEDVWPLDLKWSSITDAAEKLH